MHALLFVRVLCIYVFLKVLLLQLCTAKLEVKISILIFDMSTLNKTCLYILVYLFPLRNINWKLDILIIILSINRVFLKRSAEHCEFKSGGASASRTYSKFNRCNKSHVVDIILLDDIWLVNCVNISSDLCIGKISSDILYKHFNFPAIFYFMKNKWIPHVNIWFFYR